MGLQVATHNRTRYSQLFSLLSCRDEGKEAKERNTKGKKQQHHQSDSGRFFKFYFKQTKKTREKTTGSFKSSSFLFGWGVENARI